MPEGPDEELAGWTEGTAHGTTKETWQMSVARRTFVVVIGLLALASCTNAATLHLGGGSITTSSTGAWATTFGPASAPRFDLASGSTTITVLGLNMRAIAYDGTWGWPPVATDYGAQAQLFTDFSGGKWNHITLHSCGAGGSWDSQGTRYTNADGFRKWLIQTKHTDSPQTSASSSQYNCEPWRGPRNGPGANTGANMGPENSESDVFDLAMIYTPTGAGNYTVKGRVRMHYAASWDEMTDWGPYRWQWNKAINNVANPEDAWHDLYDGTYQLTGFAGDVTVRMALQNWAVVQPQTWTISWEDVIVEGTVSSTPDVVWVDDDWTGPDNCGGHIWGYDAFAVIQQGVNAVAAGGTVNVAAGAYSGDISITKALILQGPANSRPDPTDADYSDEAVTTGCITRLADDVTIAGLMFTGRWGICTNGVANLMVCYNRAVGTGLIYNEPGMGTYTNIKLEDNCMQGSYDGMHGNAWVGGWAKNNVFEDMTYSAINTECTNFEISGNTVDGAVAYGFQLYNASGDVLISDNTITDTGWIYGEDDKGGVRLYGTGFTGPITISNNTITNSYRALCIKSGGDITGKTISVTGNTFGADNEMFIWHGGTGDLTALKSSNSYEGTGNDDAAIEAKVWHDVDVVGLGHVDWGQGAATATNLSVQNVSGAKGATVQLAARLTAGGSALAGQAVAISVDGAAVGSPVTDSNGWARIDYTITQNAGAFNINAAFGGVFNYKATAGTGTLTVTAPAPTSISVTMAPNSVAAGQTSTATVTGSNGVDYSAAATCYIQYGAGGSWAGNVYTSAKAGTWTVTAVYGSLAATTTLTVSPGAAASVTLAPATASITTDQSQAYTVQATDNQGNSWTPAVGDITWNHDGQGAFNGMIYEPDAADGGNVVNITASVGGVVSNPAALTVISSGGAGTPLILAWDRDTATFYLCNDAANPQTGTALAMGNNTVGTVTVTVAKTGSSSTDLFATVTNAGVPTNSLRVRWYLRSGAVDKCYSYSTINGTTHTAVHSLGRTSVDGGRSQVGFFGLAHNLNADPPTGITYSVAQQP